MGGEIDKNIVQLTLNNVNVTLFGIGGSSCPPTTVITSGSLVADSTVQNAWICGGPNTMMTNVFFATPHMNAGATRNTISLNTDYVGTLSISNSTFQGGDGASIPLNAATASTPMATIDGTVNTVSGNQIDLKNITPGHDGNSLLRCTANGGPVDHIGMATTVRTIASITKDASVGAFINLVPGAFPAIANNDTIKCHSWQAGSVVLTGNTYLNYGGAPTVP
jgi:hypothetical protein